MKLLLPCVIVLSCVFESSGFCQKAGETKEFKFIFTGEIPASARPIRGEGSSKIQIINNTKDYVALGFINREGNLSTGYTDGNKGQTDYYIGPGSRTHKDWPFIVANGACFVLYTLKGNFLGYGITKETGEYEIGRAHV